MPQMKFTLIRNHLEALQQIETSAGSASWQVVYHKATLQLPNTLFDLCKPSLLLTLFNELCAFFYLPAECDAPFQFCSACTVGLTLLFQSKEMLLLMRRWKLEFKYQTDECYVKKRMCDTSKIWQNNLDSFCELCRLIAFYLALNYVF